MRKPDFVSCKSLERLGVADLRDILKHLLSKSKIRGWLICEIGLYASI